MITDGPYLTGALGALGLQDVQAEETRNNAARIIGSCIVAYGGTLATGIDPSRLPNELTTGLVYGRIQSGKTRAMIASTALAFDNGFRVSVVLTSNINDLVSQTHVDFTKGLPGITIFTKDTDLTREVENTTLHLEHGDGRLLLVCSKGSTSLPNISAFLTAIAADRYPTIIFDDEGDQASLDTNVARRARTPAVAVAPSAINDIIQNQLRPSVPRHIYVSVTGTPQAVLLQSADSSNRPSFITMLPPGNSYVGGDSFFDTEEPEDNARLISLVDQNEKLQLLAPLQPIPSGLRRSILFFLVSAAAAIRTLGMQDHGYSYLCHPSLRNNEQAIADERINGFLTGVLAALLGAGDPEGVLIDLQAARNELVTTLGAETPSWDQLAETLSQHLPARRLLVINASVKRQGIAYGRGLNFLIGGNTLGRGIAIRDLLATYYVREAKVSQIDTMHQHARMYGYRAPTLAYTRLFIPRHLYYRFRDIHRSDEDLRAFIEDHQALPATFPVEYAVNLRATRPAVLEVGKIDTLQRGMHIYPNYIVVPQDQRAYARVLAQLGYLFGVPNATPDIIERSGAAGVQIDAATAAELVSPIKTKSRNTWRDSTISDVIGKVAGQMGGNLILRFRTADRTVGEGGFISTGTLSGDELRSGRARPIPTLWIMSATTRANSAAGPGQRFMYPTLVIPDAFPQLYIFNRGS